MYTEDGRWPFSEEETMSSSYSDLRSDIYLSSSDDEDRSYCCCSLYGRDPLTRVMRKLHLKKGVVTKEECSGLCDYGSKISLSYRFGQLSLVLCVKPKKQLETAIKILKVQQNKLPAFRSIIHHALGPLLVLSDMYDGDLLTSEDVQEMKKMEGDLMTRLVSIQCMKEIDNIKRAAEIMSMHGYDQESEMLTVLSDMYDGDLLTSEDVQEMKRMEGDLMTRLVFIQYMKEIDNIKTAAEIMSRHGYNQESEMLTVFGTLIEDGLMTRKDIQDYHWDFSKTKRHFIDLICSIQCTKDHTVITRTVEILEKYSFTEGDIAVTVLKVLGALVQDGLMSKENIHEVLKKCRILSPNVLIEDGFMSESEEFPEVQKDYYDWQRGLSLVCRIQCTKEDTVIARTVEIFEKCGCTTNEVKDLSRFRVLGAIAQEGLMSKTEVQSVQRKYERDGLHGGVRLLCMTQSGKEPSVMSKTSNILEEYGFEQEAKMLEVQDPTDQDGLMSKKDMGKVSDAVSVDSLEYTPSSNENPSTEEKIDFQAELVKAAIERGGSVEVEIVKCVTLGPPAAGKTQLKRALSGDVQESTESTPVSTAAEVVMECFIDDKLKWEKFDHTKLQSTLYHTVAEKEYDARRSVFYVPEEEPLIPPIDRLQLPPPTVPQFSQSKLEDATTPILPRNTTTPQHTQPTGTVQPKPSIEDAFSSLKERVLRNLSQTLGEDHLNKVRMIHLVDSGGQPAFFDFHPMVATSRAMYLIVYNSEKGLLACPEITYRKHCQFVTKILSNSTQTNLDMIKRSLHTLHHCKKKFLKMEKELQKCLREDNDTLGLSDVLPVIIVGSRKNTCSQSFKEATRLLESHCCNIPTWKANQPDLMLVESLDPTCSGVKELRETVSNAESKFKIRFPLLWFHCQLIFWSTDDPALSVMTYQDLRKLCTQHNLVSSDEEFLALLTTFHMLGIFSCPDIDHTDVDPDNTDNLHSSPVFTNPDVLYQQVTRILEIPFYEMDNLGHKITFKKKEALTTLQKQGLLTSGSLALLGVPDELGSFSGFHTYLLNCLLRWGLAAKMPGDQLQLFIPSILPPRSDRKFVPSDQEGPIPPLALTIYTEESTEYFVPQGLFPHFVVNIMNHHSKGYEVRVGTGPATPRCRDVIAIVKKAKGGTEYPYNIYAVDNIDHISIHINPAHVDDKNSPKWSTEDCGIIVRDLEDFMQDAYSRLFGTTTNSSVILCCPCDCCQSTGQEADPACGEKRHLAKLVNENDSSHKFCLSQGEGTDFKDCDDVMNSIVKASKRPAHQRKREPIPNVVTSSPKRRETGSHSAPMSTGDTPQPPSTSAGDTSPSQHPQSLEFYSLTPSDVGLNKVVELIPLWQGLAVNLGVPAGHVQANKSESLGGLLSLQYWRDGRSGQSFPSNWKFLLENVEDTFGENIAKDLEKKAISNPRWSKDQ